MAPFSLEIPLIYDNVLHREHLGIDLDDPNHNDESEAIDVSDPVSDSFYHDVWMKHAKTNTAIFEKVSYHFLYALLVYSDISQSSIEDLSTGLGVICEAL